jgi:undecaprenyl-diphosphatase
MTGWEALALGLIQGLTEFLPVSSSGHLVMGHILLGLESDVPFDAMVHGATLLATIVYFRHQLIDLVRGRSVTYIGKLALGTLPAAVIGLVFRDAIERSFASAWFAAATLAATGVLLLSLYFVPRERWRGARAEPPAPEGAAEPSWAVAWWVGWAQALSILPAISRSGATIVTAIWLGMAPAAAAEFSFILGIPAIAGAVVLEASAMRAGLAAGQTTAYLIGAAAAFVSGILAIYLVFRLLARREFRWFGFYCLAVAALFAAWLWMT